MSDQAKIKSIDLLHDGVYELILTTKLSKQLALAFKAKVTDVDDSELTRTLINHLIPLLRNHLDKQESNEAKIDLVNQIIRDLSITDAEVTEQKKIDGIINKQHSGISKIEKLPEFPLSELALLTNKAGQPQIGSEIKAELQSADAVDILMSFVMTGGVNFLKNELTDFANRGGKIRLITSTYMGTSNAAAIFQMADEFGAEIKINFSAETDRLHAKSWIFHRETGFSSAYVGSSNLSKPALFNGAEWNLKVSQYTNPEIFKYISENYNAIWRSDQYKTFDANDENQRNALIQTLAQHKPGNQISELPMIYQYIEVTPLPHQEDMLSDLEIERVVHGHHKNLVVAATGTGKTMLAALDYKRSITQGIPKPKLLFVAHKKEILDQAINTFRLVLKDLAFGEKFVDGEIPSDWNYVFASIQSLHLKDKSDFIADHFDFVIVDEFHHAEANTYKNFLDFINPKELLALTATPERTDLKNVQDTYFGGRIASELRLWDAISQELLVPFAYFGIADGTDLSDVKWGKGTYAIDELERIYVHDESHIKLVYNSLIKYVSELSNARIIAFCASIGHAEFVASFLNKQGLKSVAVTAKTPSEERKKAITNLRNGAISVLCAVDILNEGVDIPAVDTVLFLRPTDSPLIFLQQLGRGLRKAPGKQVLTVLDFVGAQNTKYRFDKKLQAIAFQSKLGIQKALESDQFHLPPGCQIVFDKKAKELVLANLKAQLKSQFDVLVEDLKERGDISLSDFLAANDLVPSDIYSKQKTWTAMRYAAGFIPKPSKFESDISRTFSRFFTASDNQRNKFYKKLLNDTSLNFREMNKADQVLTAMFFWNIFDDGRMADNELAKTYAQGVDLIRNSAPLKSELLQILDYASAHVNFLPQPLTGDLAKVPLSSHASYTKNELLAAFGRAQLENCGIWGDAQVKRPVKGFQEGVWYEPGLLADVFFVTLKKNENVFSISTMYKDFAKSKNIFHWESQNRTSPESVAGKRYINQVSNGTNIVLAIRESNYDDLGSAPYVLIGLADVQAWAGDRPMEFDLKTHRDIPNNLINVNPFA